MKRNTFIIRFIDVGLIILFGFVIISDITIRTQIDLGGSDSEQQIDDKLGLFIVSIQPGIYYELLSIDNSLRYGTYDDVIQLDVALQRLRDELRQNGKIPVALIAPNDQVAVQHMVDVMDLCDRIGLQKSLKTD
jgi:biopolymer transport protein ExbD